MFKFTNRPAWRIFLAFTLAYNAALYHLTGSWLNVCGGLLTYLSICINYAVWWAERRAGE